MHVFCIMFGWYIAVVAAVSTKSQGIVGGSLTNIARYPAIAGLLYSSDSKMYTQACVGTVLTSRFVISAAHCFKETYGGEADRWRVRVGSSFANSGGKVYSVASIMYHPSYNNTTLDYDVTIVRTASNIVFVGRIQSASIAKYELGDNEAVWAVGWGKTSVNGEVTEQLRHIQMWTVNQATCAQLYATLNRSITAAMLCSGRPNVDSRQQCQGNSGAPLLHNRAIVGILSWGSECAKNVPGVNARISRLSSWINANI